MRRREGKRKKDIDLTLKDLGLSLISEHTFTWLFRNTKSPITGCNSKNKHIKTM